MVTGPGSGPGYRVDDLAELTGVSVRNIRVYQERGLLPAPRREGRVAWYSERHVSRLRLIAGMLERGYTFALIEELLIAARRGMRVTDLLGAAGPQPAPEQPVVTAATLADLVGAELDSDAVDRIVALGALRPDPDAAAEIGLSPSDRRFVVASPDMLAAAGDLLAAGVAVDQLLDLAEQVRDDVDQIAAAFVELVTDRYFGRAEDPPEQVPPVPGPAEVGRLADLIAALRPQANRVLELLLEAAMDRRIDQALALAAHRFGTDGSGATAP